MSNRHLGALIVALYVIIAIAVTIGFTVQAHNESARRHAAVRESKDRTVAVCNAENETRQAFRRLARDLTHRPDVLALVDREFADKDCKHIVNHAGS